VTLAEALALQPAARRLFVAALRGRLSTRVEDAIREIVLLRVMARIREGDEPWSLSVEENAHTILIRTQTGRSDGAAPRLNGPLEHVAWNHSEVAQAVPIYPRHPRWGWMALGLYGRYDFRALAEVARNDPATARSLLARALESGRYDARRSTGRTTKRGNDQ
jgi:hypothetical protein